MILIPRRLGARLCFHKPIVLSVVDCGLSDNKGVHHMSKTHVDSSRRRDCILNAKHNDTTVCLLGYRQLNTYVKNNKRAKELYKSLKHSEYTNLEKSGTSNNTNSDAPSANEMSLIASMMISDNQQSASGINSKQSEQPKDDLSSLHQSVEDMNNEIMELEMSHDLHEDASGSDDFEYEEQVDELGDGYIEELSLDTQKPQAKPAKRGYSGTCDPSSEISSIPCQGCGAHLHCKETGLPGYMPSEKYKSIPTEKLREHLCQRCFLMKTYNIALNAKVSAEEYPPIISQIKHVKNALVLIIIDLTDITNSIYKDTLKLIGRHPVFIIGNKVDLLPRDARGYLERTKEALIRECVQAGFSESRIEHSCLISGKTGYGVEELVTKLMNAWNTRGHVYMVGCTNVGKSTIYNALLSSDYCKSRASDHIQRATTSIWPGTTLNLLRFPIVTPTPWRLFRRTQRLLKERSMDVEEQRLRKNMLQSTGHARYATLIGHIGQTFKQRPVEYEGHTLATYTSSSTGIKSTMEGREAILPKQDKYNEELFVQSRWCHDTPGVVNPEQIINLMSQEELDVLLSKRIIMPRTFVMRPTQVMFVSGLGRIDYTEGPKSVYVTVFSSTSLPVFVQNQSEADEFYSTHHGTSHLKLPIGGAERLNSLPSLEGKEFFVSGIGWKESACDITLSSIGWVAITAGKNMETKFKVYTPGGAGIHMRHPALLRHAVSLRGKRIGKSAVYQVRKPNHKM